MGKKRLSELEQKIEVDEDFFLEAVDNEMINAKKDYETSKEIYCHMVKLYEVYLKDKKAYHLTYYFDGDKTFYEKGDKRIIGFQNGGK